MSEIIQLLKLHGVDPDEAEKSFKRYYAWLHSQLSSKDTDLHFEALEESRSKAIVTIKDISASMVCRHHLMPVSMLVDIAYLPAGKVLGLSKFVRVVRDLATCMLQEDYTQLLAETLLHGIGCKWVEVSVSARHTCMVDRGVCAWESSVATKLRLTV